MKVFDIYYERSEPGYEPEDIAAFGIQTDDGVDIHKVNEGMSPEDVSFGRDLNFVFSIPDLLKKAYEQGRKDGYASHVEHVPELEVVEFKCKDIDDLYDKIHEIENESKKIRS